MFIEFVSLDSGERTNIKMALLYLDGKEPTQNLGIGSASALNLCSGQQRLKRDTDRHTRVDTITAGVYAKGEDRTSSFVNYDWGRVLA